MQETKYAMKITMAVLIGGFLLYKLWKFLSEIKSEIKEELAEDKLIETARKSEELPAEIKSIPQERIFATSLAAIFRAVFMSEFSTADKEKRFPIHLYTFTENSHQADPKEKLNTDWGITDHESFLSVALMLKNTLKNFEANDAYSDDIKNYAAFKISCLSSMAMASAEAGFITSDEAWTYLTFCSVTAKKVFTDNYSWDAFAQAHLAGDDNNGKLGKWAQGLHIKDLKTRPDSPWVRFPWQ